MTKTMDSFTFRVFSVLLQMVLCELYACSLSRLILRPLINKTLRKMLVNIQCVSYAACNHIVWNDKYKPLIRMLVGHQNWHKMFSNMHESHTTECLCYSQFASCHVPPTLCQLHFSHTPPSAIFTMQFQNILSILSFNAFHNFTKTIHTYLP